METRLDAASLASDIKTAEVMTDSARLRLDNAGPVSTATSNPILFLIRLYCERNSARYGPFLFLSAIFAFGLDAVLSGAAARPLHKKTPSHLQVRNCDVYQDSGSIILRLIKTTHGRLRLFQRPPKVATHGACGLTPQDIFLLGTLPGQ